MLNHFLLFFIALISFLSAHGESSVFAKEVALKETYIELADCSIFCRTEGKGKPLIVLHGGPGLSQDYLLPQLYELAESNFVIFYDQRGAGKSTGEITEKSINVPQFVEDLEKMRKAFGFDKISLLGHSWGGLLAMHYALIYPHCLDKLILSNSEPASSDGIRLCLEELTRRTAPFQEKISAIQSMPAFEAGDPTLHEQLYRLIFRAYCHNPDDANLLNLSMSASAAVNCVKVNQLFWANTLGMPFDLHAALKNLHIPTLIIHGDDDPIPQVTARAIHESIGGSTYVILKDCGHFPYVEQPKAYFHSLKEFLKSDTQS